MATEEPLSEEELADLAPRRAHRARPMSAPYREQPPTTNETVPMSDAEIDNMEKRLDKYGSGLILRVGDAGRLLATIRALKAELADSQAAIEKLSYDLVEAEGLAFRLRERLD